MLFGTGQATDPRPDKPVAPSRTPMIQCVPPFFLLLASGSEGSIAWLLSLWSLCVVALELPAGLLSDRMTRKHLLLSSIEGFSPEASGR